MSVGFEEVPLCQCDIGDIVEVRMHKNDNHPLNGTLGTVEDIRDGYVKIDSVDTLMFNRKNLLLVKQQRNAPLNLDELF